MTAQILPFPTKLGSSYFQPRITSASGDWNKIMHLRAHGWSDWTIGGITLWAHPSVMNAGLLTFDDAWQAQKAIEISGRYWG